MSRAGCRRGVLLGLLAVVALSACIRPPLMPLEPDTAEVKELESLILVFYSRVSNRRFNSISTFHDPALREFFKTPEAFADYYADFAQDLTVAHFDYNRPTSFQILGLEVLSPNRAKVEVLLEGANNLPMRFWKTAMVRVDQWERADDRWWIIPGKL